jgi:hypothetical protein
MKMSQQWRRSGKKERQDETQFTNKFGGKTSLGGSQLFALLNFHFQLRV